MLPRFDNTAYIDLGEGDQFGVIDIIGSSTGDFDPLNWMEQRSKVLRQFTTMAFSHVETLILNIEDLIKMQKEFNNEYKLLFREGEKELKNAWLLKLRATQKCEECEENHKKVISSLK